MSLTPSNSSLPSNTDLVLVDEYHTGIVSQYLAQLYGYDIVPMKMDGFYRSPGSKVRHFAGGLERMPELFSRFPNAVFVWAPTWDKKIEERVDSLKKLPSAGSRPRLVFLDTFAPSSSHLFGALEYLDGYVKSQVYRDMNDYSRPFKGGYIVADWVSRHLGADLQDWNFGSAIPAGSESKIRVGMNLGASRFYSLLYWLSRFASTPWKNRSVFVNKRFLIPEKGRVKKWEWYHDYRRFCGLEAAKLTSSFACTGHEPLGRKKYIQELWNSKVAFSPFGWGEVCFRDFESVMCGAVLLKPDMSHLGTEPNIYESWVTYVPVDWDLGNLEERCQWIADHPDESEAMVEAARKRLRNYHLDYSVFLE